MTCLCAECTDDSVDYGILARYWPVEVWFSRVGTDAERNNPSAPIPADFEPRGDLRSGRDVVPTGEVYGELTDG